MYVSRQPGGLTVVHVHLGIKTTGKIKRIILSPLQIHQLIALGTPNTVSAHLALEDLSVNMVVRFIFPSFHSTAVHVRRQGE